MFNFNSFNRREFAKAAAKVAIILLIMVLPIILPSHADATTNNPDSTPSASNININRNVIANNDEIIYGEINIPYANPPSDNADKTYVLRIMDAGKTSEYGYNLLYSYFTRGYNKNIYAFYFPAAQAPPWNTELTLRISQNPAYFASPINTDIDIPTSDYTTLSAMADNQTELTKLLIPIVDDIGNTNSVSLLTVSGGYTVLTSIGELFVRGCIPGIQLMAPSLFLVQNLALDYNDTTWTTAKFDTYESRFANTWVGDDMDATGQQFGMAGTTIMSFFVTLPMCLGVIVLTSWKFKRTDPGLMVCALFLLMTVQMGWLPKAIFASIYQLCGIYVAYLWFYARS